MTSKDHERRKYYRINDSVLLRYSMLDQRPGGDSADVQVELASGAILAGIDRELNQAINLVWRDHPEIGRALGLLNRKISVLGSLTGGADQDDARSYSRTRVNLSGSGMAFEAQEKLSPGTRLRLSIGLLPSQTTLLLTGAVVSEPELVTGTDPETYWTRVGFDEDVDAQEDLIRHVVQKQGMLLADER